RIHTVNALKNLNSLVLSWLSVAAFVIAGAIAWKEGVLMMVAATAGGFFGARWSKRLPAQAVRIGVIITGLVMTALFFWRG
ncbi:MAG: sulfite exporter TauE/SafE family protein, partial [Burkholderiales bacterium]